MRLAEFTHEYSRFSGYQVYYIVSCSCVEQHPQVSHGWVGGWDADTISLCSAAIKETYTLMDAQECQAPPNVYIRLVLQWCYHSDSLGMIGVVTIVIVWA